MGSVPVDGAPAQVLMVDDDPLMHALIEALLAGMAIDLDHASSGSEAIQKASRLAPDLVLLDMSMPEIDGIETCRRLRSLPELARVPILFVTAEDAGDAIARAFDAGASDYVRKPLEPRELRARVSNHLLLAQARRQDLARLRDSEKLAGLGELVGELGHELATPIGNVKLALEGLEEVLKGLREERDGKRLTASSFERHLSRGDEAAAIARRALAFAVDVMESFKSVAVDQCSSRRKTICLHAYLHQVVLSLRPRLKRSSVEVVIEGEPALDIETEPGAIAQIVSNLINNSLLHGYSAGQAGRITLRFAADGGALRLCYHDDGQGMPQEVVERVFDPYFTTRADSGGSGLGMHIVHSLVCERLGGSIALESAPGRGVAITMMLPMPARTG